MPDTSYPIPSGAIFLATNGVDTQPGTELAPVATLTRAIALVPSGGTVVVRGGTYRQGSTTSVSKAFTLQSYPHEQVWFDGTDVQTGWQSQGNGQYSIAWNTPSFCAGNYYSAPYDQQSTSGPCAFADEYGDPSNPAAGDPQMVFIDGIYIHEVTTLAAAIGANFFYDQTNKVLHLGTDPAGHTVELAARPSALVIQGGLGGNVIRGIGFRRYATNEYNGNATHGAVLINAPNCTLENDVFTLNAAAGLSFANATGGVVHTSVFAKNGANGMDGNGHQHSTGAVDGLDIEGNVFNGNNTERFGTGCSASCSAAGVKLAHMDGFTLQNNVFENAVGTGKGFWCDLDCSSGVMINNVFANNGDTGLFYEVSNTGIIASNLIYGNGAYGLKMGSANTKVYNNTLVGNATDVLIYDDNRTFGVGGWTDVGPDTTAVDFSNNILSSGNMLSAWRTSATSPNTGPDTFFAAMDYNAYYRPGGTPSRLFDWKESGSTAYDSCAALNAAKGWEGHCEDITSGAEPFFVDAANGDYRVRTGSVAYQSGKPLPSDVAAALGVSASAPISRGALSWPSVP